jgi:hypothetical protein
VPLCVWSQARTKRVDRGRSTAAWRAWAGRWRAGAGTSKTRATWVAHEAGGRYRARRAARAGAARAPSPQAGGPLPCTGPIPGPRSRSAVGPVHPSWPAPDLVPHSSTTQVSLFVVACSRRDARRPARVAVGRASRRPGCTATPVSSLSRNHTGRRLVRRVHGVSTGRSSAAPAPTDANAERASSASILSTCYRAPIVSVAVSRSGPE